MQKRLDALGVLQGVKAPVQARKHTRAADSPARSLLRLEGAGLGVDRARAEEAGVGGLGQGLR